ncbi:hypothetical protein ACIHAA_04660 [Streptomyces sp. NPDC052040]|uniref:hypothetical protein n=1 Tax=unclassified Streptomyces TaxID=2593676 RepID=UPI0037D5AB2D
MKTGEPCRAVRTRAVAAACGALVMSLSACGGWHPGGHGAKGDGPGSNAGRPSAFSRHPGHGAGGGPSPGPGTTEGDGPSYGPDPAEGGAPSSDPESAGETAPPQDEESPGGSSPGPAEPEPGRSAASAPTDDPGRLPGVGDRTSRLVPEASRQVLAVYGDGENSPDCTIVLYEKDDDDAWNEIGRWRGHNGRRGWTADHHEDDLRTPAGVFTLGDSGGVLADPGTRLPYDRSASYVVPDAWGAAHQHDFDYVVAIDYNRLRGTPPNDPTRPEGAGKGGGIWLHVDHGDGTSACVTLPESGMEYVLRTLDPDWDPVVVMGDRQYLAG